MLKYLTLLEWMIIGVILGIIALVLMTPGADARTTCLSHGYMWEQHTDYCTKVQDGNTIVIHADSLR